MISIITAAYNCEKYIGQAIESVLTQTYSDWEMIIVDDVSTDKTVEIVERYAQADSRIKLIQSDKKLFAAGARNLATQQAKGRYIAFLDADDLWQPEKLRLQLDFMKNNGHALSFTSYQIIDIHSNMNPYIIEAASSVVFKDLYYFNPIGCLTVMYDTHQVDKLYFPTNCTFQEDYILWITTLRALPHLFYGLAQPLACYRLHPKNRSGNKLRVAWDHWHVVYNRYFQWNFFQKCYYFSFYLFYNLRKYLKIKGY